MKPPPRTILEAAIWTALFAFAISLAAYPRWWADQIESFFWIIRDLHMAFLAWVGA